jgi:hypothetical protein
MKTIGTARVATDVRDVVTDAIARAVAIMGLGAIALIHLLDAPSKFDETPYMGWMYLGLIASCIALGVGLLRSSDLRVWAATAALPVAILIGFTLTRTTGLPQANGDIGNWTESLGLASLFVEGSLVALVGAVVATRRTHTIGVGSRIAVTSERARVRA